MCRGRGCSSLGDGRTMFVRRRLNLCRNTSALRVRTKRCFEVRCKDRGGGRSRRRRRWRRRVERESCGAGRITQGCERGFAIGAVNEGLGFWADSRQGSRVCERGKGAER